MSRNPFAESPESSRFSRQPVELARRGGISPGFFSTPTNRPFKTIPNSRLDVLQEVKKETPYLTSSETVEKPFSIINA